MTIRYSSLGYKANRPRGTREQPSQERIEVTRASGQRGPVFISEAGYPTGLADIASAWADQRKGQEDDRLHRQEIRFLESGTSLWLRTT